MNYFLDFKILYGIFRALLAFTFCLKTFAGLYQKILFLGDNLFIL